MDTGHKYEDRFFTTLESQPWNGQITLAIIAIITSNTSLVPIYQPPYTLLSEQDSPDRRPPRWGGGTEAEAPDLNAIWGVDDQDNKENVKPDLIGPDNLAGKVVL